MIENSKTHSSLLVTPQGEDLLAPHEFTSLYPYVVRYANNVAIDRDSFVFIPYSGEHDTYGVFFYALTDPSKIENRGNSDMYLFRSEDVIQSPSIPKNILQKGVMTIPGDSYKKETERISRMLFPQQLPTALKVGEHYTVGQTIYEENLVLNTASQLVNRLPIFTIPTTLTVGTSCLLAGR